MSRGPENRFISAIHSLLPPVSEFYRMKNHNEYNGGIPDCWYSARLDLWIEYKYVELPARPDTMITIIDGKKPSLSKLQQEWITSRVHEGRNVWVIVGSNIGGLIERQGWGPGRWRADDFKAQCVPRHQIAKAIEEFCR